MAPANAQTTPALTIPKFTVSFVNRSYTVPVTTTQTTDPFTGQPVTHTSGGQYVENYTIDVKIENPGFRAITLSNGSAATLYYTIRSKGHFADWDPISTNGYCLKTISASESDYTIVTLKIANNPSLYDADVYIPIGAPEDFQVEANAGYTFLAHQGLVVFGTAFSSYVDSGWSDIQTLNTSDNSVSTTPFVNPSPTATAMPMATPTLTATPTPAPISETPSATPNTETPSPTLPTATATSSAVANYPSLNTDILEPIVIAILLAIIAALLLLLRKRKTANLQ
jgi:Predicted solute binding protein